MCGIFFYKNKGCIKGELKKTLTKCFMKIKHRGPDSSKIRYYNDDIMLGFHRLSIVGISDSGMQPFENERFVCIVNGEIYNYIELQKKYKFNLISESDCEIILHMFTSIINSNEKASLEDLKSLCSELDGEFAFIIYDTKSKITYYGVDELRMRPLFIGTVDHDDFSEYCLASEQKAIPKNCKYIKAVESAAVGIIFSEKEQYFHHKYNYFSLDSIKIIETNMDIAVKKIKELLIENVVKKLNSDREFGFLLSGGVDSSLVAGIASDYLSPIKIKTFTGGFDLEAKDIIAARKVSKHINSIHTEFIFTYQEGINVLKDVIYYNESWDQTSQRASSIMYLIIKAIKEKHPEIRIIFGGEVADELLMGYLEWSFSPSPEESRKHSIKRLKDITYFDGLRADRVASSCSMEIRFPFFSKKILEYVLSLPTKLLMPQHNNNIEKFILRKAFENDNFIPYEILYRTKNAFSDSTSVLGKNSWKNILKEYSEKMITDSRFDKRNVLYPYNTPQTKEDMLYREIFDEFGYSQETIPYKWLPNWVDGINDSSATSLNNFKEN